MKGQVFAIIGVIVLITILLLRVEVAAFMPARAEPMLGKHFANLLDSAEESFAQGMLEEDMRARMDSMLNLSSGFFEQRGIRQELTYSYYSNGSFALGNFLGKEITSVTVKRETQAGTDQASFASIGKGSSAGHDFGAAAGWFRITVTSSEGSFSYSGEGTTTYLDAKLGYEGSYLRETHIQNRTRWHDERP